MQEGTAQRFYWEAEFAVGALQPLVVVGDPLTLEASFSGNITGQLGQGSFKIYNLNANTRVKIEFDRFATTETKTVGGITTTTTKAPNQLYLPFTLRVGTSLNALAVVFKGNIQQAFSSKSEVDIVTQIDCVDGAYGINNSYIDFATEEPTNTGLIMQAFAKSFKESKVGYISPQASFNVPFYSYSGRVYEQIREIAVGDNTNDQGIFYINQETINVIMGREAFVFGQQIPIIDSSLMVGSPRASGSYIELDLVFTNELQLGQMVELRTNINSYINGQYKIVGLSSNCTLGNARVGSNITTVQLYRPNNAELIPIQRG